MDAHLASYATVRQLEFLEAIDKHGSKRAAARALGCAPSTIRMSLNALEALAARKAVMPAHGLVVPAPDGFKAKGASIYREKTEEHPAHWLKLVEDTDRQAELRRAALDAMVAEIPRLPASAAVSPTRDDLCNLYTFTDFHLGMLAWHREGGADWDLKIAERVLWDSFRKMVDAAPDASTAVLNIQGDFLHSDGLLPVTPAHHHVLDQDGRFSKIVDVAIRVLRRLITHALEKHAKVHLLICEGNHDESSAVWLRRMFAALYDREPRLEVNDSDLPFYVFQHGDVMLAFHHGHKVKNEQLPMLFAAQFPRVWGATTKRYCHTGHRHHVDEKEYSGMTVTQHPTLSARDAYAARGGWIAERAAIAITYHCARGQTGRVYVSPDVDTLEVAETVAQS